MLFILVGLEDNGGKSSGGTDGLWGAKETVASIKAFFKEFAHIGLAASKGTGG